MGYLPIVIAIALAAMAVLSSKDNTETDAMQSSQASAQAAQPPSGTERANVWRPPIGALQFDRADYASDRREGAEEGPIEQAWEAVKEGVEEGREAIVEAFTDEEKEQPTEDGGAAEDSAQAESAEEGPVEEAWDKAKEALDDGREAVVDAFTDEETKRSTEKGNAAEAAAQ